MTAHARLLPRYRHARDRTEEHWITDPPSSDEAFGHADRLESAWLADVSASQLRDERPSWVRSSWRTIDQAATIDRAAQIDRTATIDQAAQIDRAAHANPEPQKAVPIDKEPLA
jgi:hypothetical protein